MDKKNFTLDFLFQNQEETEDDGVSTSIQGDIPPWVRGTIFAVGPGKFHFKETGFSVNHYADGLAMICKLAVSGNKLTLWKKYERSDALKKALVAGKPVLAELYTPSSIDVTKSTFGRIMSLIPENSDNGNHGVFYFGNRIFITNGLAFFRDINPKDLSSGSKYDTNKNGMSCPTPHPCIDYDGTMYNTGVAVAATGAKQKIFKIPPCKPGEAFKDTVKRLKTICTLPTSRVTTCNFHHSLTMSENYILLVEQPYVINLKKMVGWMLTGGQVCMNEIMEWHPEEINRFIIIEKNTGKIHKRKIISSEPFFFLHFVNCYEEENQLVTDILVFPDNDDIHRFTLTSLTEGKVCSSETKGIMKRFTLPLSDNIDTFDEEGGTYVGPDNSLIITGKSMSKQGLQHHVTINPNYRYRRYRYAYGIAGFFNQGPYASRVTKMDLVTGEEKAWELGKDCLLGELVFIPNPDGNNEDDGVLMAFVATDLQSGGRRLAVFICANTMKELGRAEMNNPMAVYCHVTYVPKLF